MSFTNNKIIGLAPMAGYTDSPLRIICKQWGADLVYTGLVAAKGIIYDTKKEKSGFKGRLPSLELARFLDEERPIQVQIFGNEPQVMAEAAATICDKYNPEGIDINMGCPAKKVVKNESGSSLLLEPKLAYKIVKEVKKTIGNHKLSVKSRLGWQNKNEISEFAKGLEEAGADMLAIHCRTKLQEHKGSPDWEAIADLKGFIKMPILANGGVTDIVSAKECLRVTKADGLLIGRAALGRPWIFKELKDGVKIELPVNEIAANVIDLVEINDKLGLSFIELKKLIPLYFKGISNAGEIRKQLVNCQNTNELRKMLGEI